jgi:hypothetical protein
MGVQPDVDGALPLPAYFWRATTFSAFPLDLVFSVRARPPWAAGCLSVDPPDAAVDVARLASPHLLHLSLNFLGPCGAIDPWISGRPLRLCATNTPVPCRPSRVVGVA